MCWRHALFDPSLINTTALKRIPTPSTNPPHQRLSRNAVIALAVIVLHAGIIWALQTGLLMRTAELLVPAEVLAQLIEPPRPKPETAPPPTAVAPARAANPAPAVKKKTIPNPEVRPQAQPQPAAIADPTPAPNAPTGNLAPAAPAPAPPSAEATAPSAPAPAAPPRVEPPSSNADYLQNPKPAYPPLSKRLGEQGKVIVRVLIGADGVPQKAEIRQSSGFERLDQAALNTALKWRYVPGKRGGVAEDMWFNVPINFVLE